MAGIQIGDYKVVMAKDLSLEQIHQITMVVLMMNSYETFN